jgi:hypothetical protein
MIIFVTLFLWVFLFPDKRIPHGFKKDSKKEHISEKCGITVCRQAGFQPLKIKLLRDEKIQNTIDYHAYYTG